MSTFELRLFHDMFSKKRLCENDRVLPRRITFYEHGNLAEHATHYFDLTVLGLIAFTVSDKDKKC
ncbi:MAG: hypothetical protein DRQ64_05520, partial [Gammaproteobacteria bacterium]